MELRQLWYVIKRRWLLVLIPFLAALVLGLATFHKPPLAYNVGVRYSAGLPPRNGEGSSYEDERYYPWLTSEYIVNGLRDWVTSGSFASAVSQELSQHGLSVPANSIRGSIAAENVRSVLLLSMTYGDKDVLAKMIDAATAVLQNRNQEAFPFQGEAAVVTPLDDPVINQAPAGLKSALNLPIRLALAVGSGLGLAFLVDYLDPTVQTRKDLDGLGFFVLAEIPRGKKGMGR